MSSLKDRIPEELKSRVIYKLDCSGCHTCYVGMTSRHLKTRLAEHQRDDATVKQLLSACSAEDFSKSVPASCFKLTTLAISEALFIEKLKPSINSKEEQTSRPLTAIIMKILFQFEVDCLFVVLCYLFHSIYDLLSQSICRCVFR